MIKLTDRDDVLALKSNLRATFDTPHGQEIIKFLEQICGWYDFKATDRDIILNANGKRQVLASIKTLLKLTPDEIIALAKQKEV